MKPITVLLLALSPLFSAFAQSPFEGRWDLTVKTAKDSFPSWLEIRGDASAPEIRVQGRVSSVHAAKNVKIAGNILTFSSSEWMGKPTKVEWQIKAAGGKLMGTQTPESGAKGTIAGVKAPKLDRPIPRAWAKPEPIFNGKDLTGWRSDGTAVNHYKAINGELVNEAPGANLVSTRKFQDYKLHVEYNCPQDGNSGIYLRGRYEVQVAYESPGKNDRFHEMGSIYGFLAPSQTLPDKPGQWETFDITLVGRHVTIVRNGMTTIDNQEIPGITGGALDSREAEPNYMYIQGDHTGGMKYRNMTVSLPAK